MPDHPTAPCRLCGREIVWGTDAERKRIPLDPRAPVYQVQTEDGPELGEVLVATRDRGALVSHFATCAGIRAGRRPGQTHAVSTAVRATMVDAAERVRSCLPEGVPFTLLVWPDCEVEGPGVHYISTADREDTIRGMRETADRLAGRSGEGSKN